MISQDGIAWERKCHFCHSLILGLVNMEPASWGNIKVKDYNFSSVWMRNLIFQSVWRVWKWGGVEVFKYLVGLEPVVLGEERGWDWGKGGLGQHVMTYVTHVSHIVNYILISPVVITRKAALVQAGRRVDCPDLPHEVLHSLWPTCFILTLN